MHHNDYVLERLQLVMILKGIFQKYNATTCFTRLATLVFCTKPAFYVCLISTYLQQRLCSNNIANIDKIILGNQRFPTGKMLVHPAVLTSNGEPENADVELG